MGVDRIDVDDYIQETVPDAGFKRITTALDWDATMAGPKRTYESVVEYFGQRPNEEQAALLKEPANIRRSAFESMRDFENTLKSPRKRLDTTGFKLSDETYTWIAVKAIKNEYPTLYSVCLDRIKISGLGWEEVMESFRHLK